MIDYIRYTVDGKTYELVKNDDGTWSKDLNAPTVAGRYDLILEIGQGSIITYIDSSDTRYKLYLDVIENIDKNADLIKYVPKYERRSTHYNLLFNVENIEIDMLNSNIKQVQNNVFIRTANNEAITRLEAFLGYKGLGTLEQRKSYLISLFQRSKKLNEEIIKDVTGTIAGSDCIVTFFSADEPNNPRLGNGYLRVQILSPDNTKNYRYDDIFRALQPLVPAHLLLEVIKYFGTWAEAMGPFESWNDIYTQVSDWQAIKDYIPDVGD